MESPVDGIWEIAIITVMSITASMDIIGRRTGVYGFSEKADGHRIVACHPSG